MSIQVASSGTMLTTVRVAMSRTWVGFSKSAMSSVSTTSASL